MLYLVVFHTMKGLNITLGRYVIIETFPQIVQLNNVLYKMNETRILDIYSAKMPQENDG